MDKYGNAENAEKCLKFVCDLCDFKCSKQSNYILHLNTGKHNDNKLITNGNYFVPKNADETVSCSLSCRNIL